MIAAIRESFCTQWKMSVIGKRAGGGARRGTWDGGELRYFHEFQVDHFRW